MEINSPSESKESAIQQNNKDCLEKRSTEKPPVNWAQRISKCTRTIVRKSCSWTEVENPYACLCAATGLFLKGECVTWKHWVLKWPDESIGTCSVCGHGGETQGTAGEKQVGVHPGSGITISHSVSCLWAEHGSNYQDKQNKSCCSCQTAQPAGFNLAAYDTCYSIFSWFSKGHSVSQSIATDT